MRNLILFSIILLLSITSKASDVKDMYLEVMNTIKVYCRPDQYFNPSKKTLIRTFLKSPTIGLTQTDAYTYWTISIDMKFWNSNTIDMRYELMAHEIMHALFFKEHVDNDNNFMYPIIRDLKKEETKKQLIEFLKEECRS